MSLPDQKTDDKKNVFYSLVGFKDKACQSTVGTIVTLFRPVDTEREKKRKKSRRLQKPGDLRAVYKISSWIEKLAATWPLGQADLR